MLSQSDNAVNSRNSVNSGNSFKSITSVSVRSQSVTVCHYTSNCFESQSQAVIPLNSVSPHILSLFRIILRKGCLVNQSSGIVWRTVTVLVYVLMVILHTLNYVFI